MLPIITLFTWIGLVRAQTQTCVWPQYTTDHFLFPLTRCNNGNYTGLNVYPAGTKLTVRWTSKTTYLNLYLYQEWGGKDALQQLLLNTTVKAYDFNGFPSQRLAISNTFYFAIYKVNTSSPFFVSDYFNITDGSSKPGTSTIANSLSTPSQTGTTSGSITQKLGTPSGTSTPSILTNTTINNTNNTNSTITNSNGDDINDNINNTTPTKHHDLSIGLGVGLPLFSAIIALSLYFLIYLPNRKRKAATELSHFQQQPQFYDGTSSHHSRVAFSDKQVSSSPLYGNSNWNGNNLCTATLGQGQGVQGIRRKPLPSAGAELPTGVGIGMPVEMEQPDSHCYGVGDVGAGDSRVELVSGR